MQDPSRRKMLRSALTGSAALGAGGLFGRFRLGSPGGTGFACP